MKMFKRRPQKQTDPSVSVEAVQDFPSYRVDGVTGESELKPGVRAAWVELPEAFRTKLIAMMLDDDVLPEQMCRNIGRNILADADMDLQ